MTQRDSDARSARFCVVNLRNSPAITCNSRLEPGDFLPRSACARINQRLSGVMIQEFPLAVGFTDGWSTAPWDLACCCSACLRLISRGSLCARVRFFRGTVMVVASPD